MKSRKALTVIVSAVAGFCFTPVRPALACNGGGGGTAGSGGHARNNNALPLSGHHAQANNTGNTKGTTTQTPAQKAQAKKAAKQNFQAHHTAGQQAAADGNLPLAYRDYNICTTCVVDDESAQQLDALAQQIADQAQAAVTAADADTASGKYTAAMAKYQTVASLIDFNISQTATDKLAALQTNPEYRMAAREALASSMYARARVIFDNHATQAAVAAQAAQAAQADAGLPNGESFISAPAGDGEVADDAALASALPTEDRVRVAGVLDNIVHKYAETPTGHKSDGILKQLTADTAVAAAINSARQEVVGKADYTMGMNYLAAERRDKAAERFARVVQSSPDSQWGKLAAAQLKELGM